ncbi:MAG: four-carbon acid sugar kinase family protein [Desulfobacterales bacterium]|nr:four-carbon acid sugar kinase family protein [Desulfobacterales bacterium]
MKPVLGCIADDITGATDLALMLGRNGMPVMQFIGCPAADTPWPEEAAAVVVALKSRTAPVAEAIADSLAACRWLQACGVRQFFFKYCSTFDSTTEGNIGPVAAALREATGGGSTIFCPAFPVNQRTVYQGHLFVGDRLLSASSMRNHPLTPMKDNDLVRFLGRQLPEESQVGLVGYEIVRQGAAQIRAELARLDGEGIHYVVVDALDDRHLARIAEACDGMRLLTGGSALALGLPANYRAAGWLPETTGLVEIGSQPGPAAVLSGSCSVATREQVATMAAVFPALRVDPLRLADGRQQPAELVAWATEKMQQGPVLVYASASPEAVAEAQTRLGSARAGDLVEAALAAVAAGLYREGLKQLIVAGGETSGAVLKALNIQSLRIGPEIEPGVPWTVSAVPAGLVLALKSGNFGRPDFFLRAMEMLQ